MYRKTQARFDLVYHCYVSEPASYLRLFFFFSARKFSKATYRCLHVYLHIGISNYFLRWKMHTRSNLLKSLMILIVRVHYISRKQDSTVIWGFIFVCFAAMPRITNFLYVLINWYTFCNEQKDTKTLLLRIIDTKNGQIAKYKYFKAT